jgi:hypothetical protein
MALKAYMGNKLIFDDDGYVHGVVKTVELATHKDDKGEWESLRWVFETIGSLRPYELSELTGLAMHPRDKKTGEYNKLTAIVTKLGILSDADLEAEELPDHDLESAIGQCVKFKVLRKDGFYRVDLTTLALDEKE